MCVLVEFSDSAIHKTYTISPIFYSSRMNATNNEYEVYQEYNSKLMYFYQ